MIHYFHNVGDCFGGKLVGPVTGLLGTGYREDSERSVSIYLYYMSRRDWMSPYRHPKVSGSDYALILSRHDGSETCCVRLETRGENGKL